MKHSKLGVVLFATLAQGIAAGCVGGGAPKSSTSNVTLELAQPDDGGATSTGDDADASGDDSADAVCPMVMCPTYMPPPPSATCTPDAGDDASEAGDDAALEDVLVTPLSLQLSGERVLDLSSFWNWITSFFCSQPQSTSQQIFNDLAGCGLSIAGGASKVASTLGKIRSCYSAACNQDGNSISRCLASISGVTIDGLKASTLVSCVSGVMDAAIQLLGAAYLECERQAQPETDPTAAGNRCLATCPSDCDKCCDNASTNCTSGRDNNYYNACRSACYTNHGWMQ
jgi:hypothetical protein